MRWLIDQLKGVGAFLLLAVMLFSWGSSVALAAFFTTPGGGTGGFTGRPLITVEITADKTSVPVNLAGFGPNPSLPYTSTITVQVKQDGRLIGTDITIDRISGSAANGSLFQIDDADQQAFQRVVLADTSGIGVVYFRSNTEATKPDQPITITATAQDPNTNQTVSSSVQIQVIAEERRPATMTFTGPYVNAVIAGESRFGTVETPIQNGAYSRVISVVVADADGRPTNPNTQINFFLIDGPITGYPEDGPGKFVIAGTDGDPVEGQIWFSAASGDFLNRGARPSDWLVLTGQPRKVERVLNSTTLLIRQQGLPFNLGANAGAIFPYVVGHAENGAILSPSFTDLNGVASTTLTYPVTRIGQTAILMACTTDYSNCGILNTCDAQGKNCKSVYLGVTNGSDRTLTVSATSLGPNRSTDVRMCLRDPNFTPLPATEIRYDIGSVGPATVKVTIDGKETINDKEGKKGSFMTGADGCAAPKITSSGQIPGSEAIEIQFTSDYVAAAVPVTIKSPGAGKMDGLFSCEFEYDKGAATCSGTLRLTDDEGSPMSGVLIGLGDSSAAFPFELTFDPAEGVFGKTNDQGQVQVTINLSGPGDYTFLFQTAAGGTATYEFAVTVPVPGTLKLTVVGGTAATIGSPFGAAITAEGGIPPYTFAVLAGALPDGLSLSEGGVITGTPTKEGTFSFVVQATDSKKQTGVIAVTITVAKSGTTTTPLVVTLTGPAAGTTGVAFNALLGATGGTAPYSFSVLAGSLPPGLSLSSNGSITGTPTTVGTFTFSVQATDSKGATGTGNFSITVSSPQTSAPTITTTSPLPDGTPNKSYAVVFAATGGTAPYTWRIEETNVLAGIGLTLNPTTGLLGGILSATSNGTYLAVIRVTDANGAFALKTFTLTVGSGGSGGPTVASIQLLADPSTLASSGQTPVTITAIARDIGNVVVKGATVTFSANNNGTLQVTQAVTDDAGKATAILTSPNDKSLRTITVTANASGAPAATINIDVVGTAITASGPDSAVIGNTVAITFTLKDSAGVGIAGQTLTIVSNPTGNTINPSNPVTDSAGQVTVQVTANVSGSIVASALGATGSKTLTVATDNFVFTTPDQNAAPIDVCLNNINCTSPKVTPPQNLTVRLTTGNPAVGVAGKTVTFDTTRGTLSALSAVTDANGNATVSISSTNAGPAVITAKTTDTASQAIQTQVSLNFVATTPTQMTLQANPGTISVNVPPSTDQKSTITATVRDAAFNLVKGATVTFTLTDVTGGSINPASAVTDEFGQASTVYTAGSASSALNGVRVDAAVTGFAVNASVTLTVAQRSLKITLGTGNTIVEPNPTTYQYPYSVLVTDTAGLPVPNALVTLNVVPVAASTGLDAYFKGFWKLTDPVPPATTGTAPWVQVITATCKNEDVDQNGIFKVPPDNDVNSNGKLEPGNVVTVSANSLTTDASGFAFFNVVYAQEYAQWVRVELSARATVAGSEATEITRFVLPILASELTNKDVSPPGNPSPFGTTGNAATDSCTIAP